MDGGTLGPVSVIPRGQQGTTCWNQWLREVCASSSVSRPSSLSSLLLIEHYYKCPFPMMEKIMAPSFTDGYHNIESRHLVEHTASRKCQKVCMNERANELMIGWHNGDAQERSEGNPRIFQSLGPEGTCPYSYSHSLVSWKSATCIFLSMMFATRVSRGSGCP